jgi:hypothetical protein
MSLLSETSRVPFSARLAALSPAARSAVAALACVAGVALLGGCAKGGACVTGNNAYFCQEDSLQECQEFWCDGYWASCSYFESASCTDLGFASESESLGAFSAPQTPDWTYGGGAGGGGGGSSSSTGACAYYDGSLNRVLCDTRSSTACPGKFMGAGTTCTGMTCTSSTNPSSCTVPGAGGGGSSGGTCSNTWTCAYDGQATPMCSWACAQTGTERTQSCQVLASYMTSGNAGECCTVCR